MLFVAVFWEAKFARFVPLLFLLPLISDKGIKSVSFCFRLLSPHRLYTFFITIVCVSLFLL